MNCIYCGSESADWLCEEHRTIFVLDELLELVGRYAPERCSNPHVSAYVESFEKWSDAYAECFPLILALFPEEDVAYERCRYLGDVKDETFEEAAIAFLDSHEWTGDQSQTVMHMLLQAYSRRNFFKPVPYVEFISETEGLLHELYTSAIDYLGMTGEYDEAVELIGLARSQVAAGAPSRWGKNADRQLAVLDDSLAQIEKWRARPYWPKSPDAREQLAEIYATKGIAPGAKGGLDRTAVWPKKVSPKDFASLSDVLIEAGKVERVDGVKGRYIGYQLSGGRSSATVARSQRSSASFSSGSLGQRARNYSNGSITGKYAELAKEALRTMPDNEPVLTSWLMGHVPGIISSQQCTKVMDVLIEAGRVEKVYGVKGRYIGYRLL